MEIGTDENPQHWHEDIGDDVGNRLNWLRAGVLGANDGIVSTAGIVMGVAGASSERAPVFVAGLAGLVAGALSMGAGEYVSVNSQLELLEASLPSATAGTAVQALDVDANELELVYRARGMSPQEAAARAAGVFASLRAGALSDAPLGEVSTEKHEAVGTGLRAAVSSFLFFASGALIPVLPYLFGLAGVTAVIVSAVLVGLALLSTGMVVGLLSGGPPLRRALRQLMIGYGAAAVTYVLGLLFGTAVS